MREKSLINFKRSTIFFLVGIVLFASLLLGFGMYKISKEIDQNQDKITHTLKQKLGFPITIKEVDSHWFGLSLSIILKEVVVYDSEEPVAFIKIDKVKVYPDIIAILIKREPKFKEIILDGLTMVIAWNKEKGLDVLGLQGETIPTTMDYPAFKELLAKQQNIIVKNAEISWQGLDIDIKQRWQGKLNWIASKELDWVLKGTQQTQVRDNFILPETRFTLSMGPDLNQIGLKLEGDDLIAECKLKAHSTEEWQTLCTGKIDQIEVEELQEYYKPGSHDPALLQWLSKAVSSGSLIEGQFQGEGSLSALQWSGQMKFKDVDFQYDPRWPAINHFSGQVEIKDKKINVQMKEGTLLDWSIEKALAVIETKANEERPTVYVSGAMNCDLKTGLDFLKNSPLRDTVADGLEPLHPRGPMYLDLKLQIPIDSGVVKVEGTVATKDAHLTILNDYTLTQLKGDFHFTEQDLMGSNLKANLEGLPLEFNVRTVSEDKNKSLEVKAKGSLDSEFLQQFNIPLLKRFKGRSLFNLVFKKRLNEENGMEWVLNSDLKGMDIQLPAPFAKKADEKRLTTLILYPTSNNSLKMSLHINNLLDAKWAFKETEGKYKLSKGHLVFGEDRADWPSKDVLMIGGEIHTLKVEEWLSFLEDQGRDDNTYPNLDLHLLVEQLDVYGIHFSKTWISKNSASDPQGWVFDGPFIKGAIHFPTNCSDPIDFNLEHLKIAKLAHSNVANIMPKECSKPPIVFKCKNLQYGEAHFGEINLNLSPSDDGYTIQNLSIEDQVSELLASGEWHLKPRVHTNLQGKISTINMGKTFLEWNYPSAIREASGHINFQLTWPEPPFQFDVGHLEGEMELKLDKGRILGVEPGLGRIMGLLNLESIRRRLQLDFSDLLKRGFVFDILRGKLNFKQGIANTEKLFIDGPSAKIELTGKADLKTKEIDLQMKVIPHAVGVGLPLAAAIAAGNPAVGAGVWIVNKLTGSKINKITQHYYHVTGSWDAPKIQELSERK